MIIDGVRGPCSQIWLSDMTMYNQAVTSELYNIGHTTNIVFRVHTLPGNLENLEF